MREELWKVKLRERAERTLHVSYPKKIKDAEEVTNLFTGDFTVKLPRQPSRNFHVEFSTVDEALKNKRALKNEIVDGETLKIRRAYSNTLSGKKVKRKGKKIKVPEVPPDVKLTQSLFVGNLKCGTKANEIKEVLPGCVSVTLLRTYSNSLRSAIVRMESIAIAAEYLLRKRPWPVLRGHKLILKSDDRKKRKKKPPLKIYDTVPENKLNDQTFTEETKDNVQ